MKKIFYMFTFPFETTKWITRYFFWWLPLSRFRTKTVRVSNIVMKSFSKKICRSNSTLNCSSRGRVYSSWQCGMPFKDEYTRLGSVRDALSKTSILVLGSKGVKYSLLIYDTILSYRVPQTQLLFSVLDSNISYLLMALINGGRIKNGLIYEK